MVWESRENDAWIKVISKGKNCRAKLKTRNKNIHFSYTYTSLLDLSADPPPTIKPSLATKQGALTTTTKPTPIPSHYRQKIKQRQLATAQQQFLTSQENNLLDKHITWAKDESTVLEKLIQRMHDVYQSTQPTNQSQNQHHPFSNGAQILDINSVPHLAA